MVLLSYLSSWGAVWQLPFPQASQTPQAAFVVGNSWCGQLLAEKLATSWECDVGLCEAPEKLSLLSEQPALDPASLAC